MSLTLEYLNLSHNKFDDQANAAFASWLIRSHGYSKLKHLLLHSCGISAFSFYSLRHLARLEHLDVSNNKLEVGSELDKLLPVLSTQTLYKLDCNHCNVNKEVLALILCKMSDKKASVQLGLMGLNLANADENYDMFFSSLLLFKDSEISIKSLNLRHVRGTEKTILTLLQVLSEIKVNELILEDMEVIYPQQTQQQQQAQQQQISSIPHSTSSSSDDHPHQDHPFASNTLNLNNVHNSSTGKLELGVSLDFNTVLVEMEDEATSGTDDMAATSVHLTGSPTKSPTQSHKDSELSTSTSSTSISNSSDAGSDLNQSFSSLLAKSLQKIYMNPELKTLNLANLGKATVMKMLPYISKNSSVASLDISKNALGDIGAQLLANSLASNRSILAINFDSNNMTNIGWNQMLISLTQQQTGTTGSRPLLKDSPSQPPMPLTSPHPHLHSMIYPRIDFEKLIVATNDPTRRMNIYLLISKLQMALITNGNLHYSDRKHLSNKFPIGFSSKTKEPFFLPTPNVLYPRTPVPAEVLAQMKIKVEQQRGVNNGSSAIATITQFLKTSGLRPVNKSVPAASNANTVVIGMPQQTMATTTNIIHTNPIKEASFAVSKKPATVPSPSSPSSPSTDEADNVSVSTTSSPAKPSIAAGVDSPVSPPDQRSGRRRGGFYQPVTDNDVPASSTTQSSSTTTTTTSTTPTTSQQQQPGVAPEVGDRASMYKPVTHQQVFDAIESLELATNYYFSGTGSSSSTTNTPNNQYTTPPKSPAHEPATDTTTTDTTAAAEEQFTRVRSQSAISAPKLEKLVEQQLKMMHVTTSSLSSLE
ncbi:hypothetical protein SAMD00019534_098370 [Acytostelium subglobosum LB1]|uniref:hypothetical protein n=1 Tax=Acytostelium subglobosum LB1 TaxID=1410327 RepID=UPI000644945B|nr:hypothetical protein SAMD00019534_098370 [Acytostelium subglobosum LB1]GAM26662.1 hypothetical protein SAMD00019534_098370 [Acytostelium subglobosum LB1]|eukprot:XP_012750323.1 hypothetical protein SAMD00019534_098370 [Acytostelium subglobosum LB1]